ncbi:hypothetical protein ACFOU2_05110 [Bacillus songklensis]|uniref:Uncharacterized protein n=1 Tax=Bacillus songklensis TaxID=1069116 RepID=A0ABV8AY65_9BACI
MGIWTEGDFCWIHPLSCSKNSILEEYYLTLNCQTFDASINQCKVLYVKVNISNQSGHSQKVKVYLQQELECQEGNDIVYYAPNGQAILHHSLDSIFVCNGKYKEKGIVQYSMRSKKQDFFSYLWKDIKKGKLCFQPFSTQNVISAFTLEGNLAPYETATATYWLIKGRESRNSQMLNKFLQKNTLEFQGEK